jgi:hypothetical protein
VNNVGDYSSTALKTLDDELLQKESSHELLNAIKELNMEH